MGQVMTPRTCFTAIPQATSTTSPSCLQIARHQEAAKQRSLQVQEQIREVPIQLCSLKNSGWIWWGIARHPKIAQHPKSVNNYNSSRKRVWYWICLFLLGHIGRMGWIRYHPADGHDKFLMWPTGTFWCWWFNHQAWPDHILLVYTITQTVCSHWGVLTVGVKARG